MINLPRVMNANDLRNAMRELPALSDSGPYPLNGSAWDRHRRVIREVSQKDDAERFLRWAEIEITMVLGDCDITRQELAYLKGLRDKMYIRAIQCTRFGGEVPMDSHISPNQVHQAYHLARFEKELKVKVAHLSSIVEFGGGYGAMCRVVEQLGFRGSYTIIDFPEISLLQNYWLDNIGSYANLPSVDGGDVPERADMVIGCYSLSEMPVGERDRWRELCPRYVLIVSQDAYNDVDNRADFQSRIANDPEYNWVTFDHPILPGHLYCLGVRHDPRD